MLNNIENYLHWQYFVALMGCYCSDNNNDIDNYFYLQ